MLQGLFTLYASTFAYPHTNTGLILGLHPANERRRYFVTTSLIGWAQTKNQPWNSTSLVQFQSDPDAVLHFYKHGKIRMGSDQRRCQESLPQSLQWYMQYHIILDRVITAPDCIFHEKCRLFCCGYVLFCFRSGFNVLIKSPRYTGGDFMFLYRFVRRRRRRRPQILVHAITFEQLFGFLSFLARLLALTYRLTD